MLNDYACPICLYLLEDQVEKVDTPDIKECPVCKKMTLARLLPISHFQISGYSYKNKYSNEK